MPVAITVQTTDAQPLVVPHRISGKAGYDKAAVTIDMQATAGIVPRDGLVPRDALTPGVPLYHALRVNNAERHAATYGIPPTIQRGLVCGLGDRCGPGRRALSVTSAVVVDDVTFAELRAEGEDRDGLIPQTVYYMTDEGWF